MKTKTFIFTEAYNCGLILKKCLESFFKYHPGITVNVFGTAKDFKELGKFDDVEYIELSADEDLKECFKHGHLGTAHIGARVIKEFSKDCNYIIHFDSDIIFRKESLSLLNEKIEEGYDLIGSRRCYKNNMNNLVLEGLEDVVQTYFFAFNKNKIYDYDFNTLRNMIVGFFNPLGHEILDYFDPVSFDILKNNGKIYFLDTNLVGGLSAEGNRKNIHEELNSDFDFGTNLVHFGGIGSGMKFYKFGNDSVPESYSKWAINRYGIYSKVILGSEKQDIEIDEVKTELLIKAFNETNN